MNFSSCIVILVLSTYLMRRIMPDREECGKTTAFLTTQGNPLWDSRGGQA